MAREQQPGDLEALLGMGDAMAIEQALLPPRGSAVHDLW
jgi:hypothetical protein